MTGKGLATLMTSGAVLFACSVSCVRAGDAADDDPLENQAGAPLRSPSYIAQTVVQGSVVTSSSRAEGDQPQVFDLSVFPSLVDQAPRPGREANLTRMRHTVWLYSLAAEISLDPPHLRTGADNRLVLRLHNGQDAAVPVTARVRPPDESWRIDPAEQQITVEAGESASASFTLDVPANTPNGKYEATIEVEAGRVLNLKRPLRVNTPLPCLQPAPVPTVDGDLGDWSAVRPTIWLVSEKTRAELRALWTDEGLYFALAVRTLSVTPGVAGQFWEADSAEIFLDPDSSGGAAFDGDDRKYWFLATGPEEKPVAGVDAAPGQTWEIPDYALRCTDEGYDLEVRIPADQLPGWPPEEGALLGCDFKINDPDSAGASASYFSGAQHFGEGAYQAPWLWGWLAMLEETATDITLSADTSHPDLSTFVPGEPVTLSFQVAGLKPNQDDLQLKLRILDEMDRTLQEQTLDIRADAEGQWTQEVAAPCEKQGFYRAFVELSNGLTLPKQGISRRKGYLTYAVIPDPTKRKIYGEKESFFGMMGPLVANVIPPLGVRWVIEPSPIAVRQFGYAWGQMEPDHPGQFAQDLAAARAKGETFPKRFYQHWPLYTVDGQPRRWQVYTLPTLFVGPPEWAVIPGSRSFVTAALKPEAEEHWRNYCLEAAKAYAECYPNREERLYQITWEPQGFEDDERLLRTYEIAYKALHELDPKAVVIGPTCSSSMGTLEWEERLLSKGLGKYLDGYSVHPYLDWPNLRRTPEQNGLIEGIRALKAMVRKHTGKDLPLFSTEQGFPTARDPSKELLQAWCHIRSNLILLGEGFRFHISFHSYDFGAEPGYGFFYNLSARAYTPDKVSPKPVVPAYAAMTFLVDGHKSSGPLEGLGENAWGYTYEGPDDAIMALWSDEEKTVSLPVNAEQAEVFNWMGNSRLVAANAGKLEVAIGPSPTYVRLNKERKAE